MASSLSLRTRVLLGLLSSVLSGALVEGAVRLADGGALPWPRIYTEGPEGRPVPQGRVRAQVLSPAGEVSTLSLGVDGLRLPLAPEPAWLAVGDSQVLGLGVEDDETFCARAQVQGLPLLNAGVPAYGLPDALSRADHLARTHQLRGVLVLLNQANDWEEGLVPVAERQALAGGRLVRRDRVSGWRARLLGGPLAGSHLVFWATLATAPRDAPELPGWLTRPESQRALSVELVDAVARFAEEHGGLVVRLAFLPLELATSPERVALTPFPAPLPSGLEPWSDHSLRDQLEVASAARGVVFIDLLEVLHGHPEAWLPHDIHLSADGHQLVADALVRALE